MNIVLLTSSRADYSIYLPLLKKLSADSFFSLKIAAFGTHTSERYGNTINSIYDDGFKVEYKLKTISETDSPEGISKSMSKTIELFADVWQKEYEWVDLIICLGDRYEMFAAISASVPFNIPVAHLYGGDVTLGAIDNSFRHSITCMSKYHFTSLESSSKKVSEIIGSNKNIYSVGSLSLDNLNQISLLTKKEFQGRFGIPLNNPVLVTFHPETINYSQNEIYLKELIVALEKINDQIIITMPNADTNNEIIRRAFISFAEQKNDVHLIESFGTIGYFSCIEYCKCMLGNSSSGITEAASFAKYVVNLGDRQKGRERGKNVIDCEFKRDKILEALNNINSLLPLTKENIYGDGKTAEKIVNILKLL